MDAEASDEQHSQLKENKWGNQQETMSGAQLSWPKLLEPVHEVADEDAANFLSSSKTNKQAEDIMADVSIVDPQV